VTITVHVAQDDIDQGIPCDARACPVVRALERATGRVWMVHPRTARRGDGRVFDLPPLVWDFIFGLDQGRTVRPITFEVEID
jgi:hypothetical protein